jgi:hypothetical protein
MIQTNFTRLGLPPQLRQGFACLPEALAQGMVAIFCIQLLFTVITNERSECGYLFNILNYMLFWIAIPTYALASFGRFVMTTL